MVDRASLSLNLSSLSVASPTNLSPVHPSPHPGSHISPITPISPSNAGLHSQHSLSPHHASHHHPHMQQQPFQFSPPDQGVRYDDPQYDYNGRRLTSSRSSSSSEKSVPRKRSFTTGTPLATSVEESAATPVSGSYDHSSTPMDTSPYDEVDMAYGGLDAEGSPVDGSTSGGEQDDQLKPLDSQMSSSNLASLNASVNVLGKPLGTNNFVTKLYQMINDVKSAQFISWTELGTSFVVSNVGEFSRTILGSHFKHNNFSSFVRQLNMYGFHKINRTPRAQRTSADVQTWEFSHHKFLRGRPDLLEEIKRKALEPDPSIKHRVELPGEVAAQLTQMRDDNRRLVHALNSERNRVEKLATVTKILYDVVTKAFPGSVPLSFPADLLDPNDSPNIMVTSPTNPMTTSHFPSLSSLSNPSLHSLHSLSPSSSPTAAEFPSHTHTPHNLSRQQSFQHIPYESAASMHAHHAHALGHGVSSARYETALSTPLPPSPGPNGLDAFGDDRGSGKRQRTVGGGGGGDDIGVSKKGSRARSDSAPLGYGLGSGWTQTRPRSGSGLGQRALGRREELPVPNIGSFSRGTLPMLSIPKNAS
ncbi:HSF-type DNA-binding-domain-containing protein [Cristinia sonorae]|uniref:HSF-type DNA-binding-domain-containing protein n=1 Tax=Cristinia sonorae TaxID=1940300 RepID=A0A8K0UKL0_9AGAR|nr:HSF-type DNA-binding-domain-containing protein [Cristinia sonorae]